MHYIYIIICANSKTYIGATSNLKARLKRHQFGQVPATKLLLPIKLHAYIAVSNKYTAYNLEKYFKSGSGRAFLKKHQLLAVSKARSFRA